MKRFIGVSLLAGLLFGCSAVAVQDASDVRLPVDEKTPAQILSEADYLVHLKVRTIRKRSGVPYESVGSLAGSIIQHEGQFYILTASHIKPVGGKLLEVTAYIRYQKSAGYKCELVGYDRRFDTAILKPTDPNFTYTGRLAELGDSDLIEDRQKVVALGSPYGLRYQSATGRVIYLRKEIQVENMPYPLLVFEHSAKTMPGYSGGPTLNMEGQIIGMEVAGYRNGALQLADAIPINDIKSILPDLIAGKVVD